MKKTYLLILPIIAVGLFFGYRYLTPEKPISVTMKAVAAAQALRAVSAARVAAASSMVEWTFSPAPFDGIVAESTVR
jgi:predicted negative regulator of RcsB-dependent stress response